MKKRFTRALWISVAKRGEVVPGQAPGYQREFVQVLLQGTHEKGQGGRRQIRAPRPLTHEKCFTAIEVDKRHSMELKLV
jgi:hypothetical protein